MLASACPKVMLRTDTEACHAAFKFFSVNNVAINNIIDLNLAAKVNSAILPKHYYLNIYSFFFLKSVF